MNFAASKTFASAMSMAALLLAGCATPAPWAVEAAPVAADCPSGVPERARCLRGQDSAGAHYLIVVPANWSGVLVVHAHGGPALGEPKAERASGGT